MLGRRRIKPEDVKDVRAVTVGPQQSEVEFLITLLKSAKSLKITSAGGLYTVGKKQAISAIEDRDRPKVDHLSPVAAKMLDEAVDALKKGEKPPDPRFLSIRVDPGIHMSTSLGDFLADQLGAAHAEREKEYVRRIRILSTVLGKTPDKFGQEGYGRLVASAMMEMIRINPKRFYAKVRKVAKELGRQNYADYVLDDKDLEGRGPEPGEAEHMFRKRIAGERSKDLGALEYMFSGDGVIADIKSVIGQI